MTERQDKRDVNGVEVGNSIETMRMDSKESPHPKKFSFFTKQVGFQRIIAMRRERLEDGDFKHGNVVVGLIEVIWNGGVKV